MKTTRLPKTAMKTECLTTRWTRGDRQALDAAAWRLGITTAELIRRRVLGARPATIRWVCDGNPDEHHADVRPGVTPPRFCDECGSETRRETPDEHAERTAREHIDMVGYLDGDTAEAGAQP
jgi:hypothetical protein